MELTGEQQEKVAAATIAMAEKFGVAREDFSVLRTKAEDGRDQLTVAYTAGNGLDLGKPKKDYDKKRSWNGIFDKRASKNFMVEVDGRHVDTRTGMTREVYNAFIAGAKANGVDPLPDSQRLADENGEVWTDTWLTGEDANRDLARLAYVRNDGKVASDWRRRGSNYCGYRFRPAVVIE